MSDDSISAWRLSIVTIQYEVVLRRAAASLARVLVRCYTSFLE